jgi:HEAT repeat protein
MRALKSNNANERLFALTVLPSVSADPAVNMPIFLENLKDPDATIRRFVAATVAHTDPKLPELLPILREALRSDLRTQIQWALGIIGGSRMDQGSQAEKILPGIPALVPEVVGLLDSQDNLVEMTASNALLTLGADAIPGLEEAIAAEGNPPKATKAEEVLKLIRERAAKEQK